MIEFVVGLVGILIVTAGILTVAILNKADTDSMVKATGDAISAAMSSSGAFSDTFTPVQDWNTGTDGMEQTKDDKKVNGNFYTARFGIAAHAAPGGDWAAMQRGNGTAVRYNDIADFHAGAMPANTFRFMRGNASETVETLPVAQRLFGVSPEVTQQNETWMPATGGLY